MNSRVPLIQKHQQAFASGTTVCYPWHLTSSLRARAGLLALYNLLAWACMQHISTAILLCRAMAMDHPRRCSRSTL